MEINMNQGGSEEQQAQDRIALKILNGMDIELNDAIQRGDRAYIEAIIEKQKNVLVNLMERASAEIVRLLQLSGVGMQTGQQILTLISDTNNFWIILTGRSMLTDRFRVIFAQAESQGVHLDMQTDMQPGINAMKDDAESEKNNRLTDESGYTSGYSPIIPN